MQTPIGDYIRGRRLARGMSISAVAFKAGIAKSTLSRWEAGVSSPCLPELEDVLGVLGVTAEEAECAHSLLHSPRAVRHLVIMPEVRDGAPHAPTTGDLLRAMRHRAGLRAADVAACIGASSTAIARLEKGTAALGHAHGPLLLGLLGATQAEMEWLSLGCAVLALGDDGGPACLDSCERDLADLARQASADEVTDGDLRFLQLESRLATLSRRQPSVLCPLAEAHAVHSEWLSHVGRFRDSGEQAAISLRLIDRAEVPLAVRAQAVSGLARSRVHGVTPSKPLRGAATLVDYMGWFEDDPELSLIMYREMGQDYGEAGRTDDSLRCLDVSESTAELIGNCVAKEMAQWVRAEVLTESGRAGEALDLLPTHATAPIQRVLNDLRWARAWLLLGNGSDADATLRDAYQAIQQHGFAHLKPHADYLAELL